MKKLIIKNRSNILLVSIIAWVAISQLTPIPKPINIFGSSLFLVIAVANLLYGLKVRKESRRSFDEIN